MTIGTSITTRDPDRDLATLHDVPEPIQTSLKKKGEAKAHHSTVAIPSNHDSTLA
jgi:hypothetical protein